MSPKDKVLTFRPDDDLWGAMVQLRKRDGVPFSEQIRRALSRWLADRAEPEQAPKQDVWQVPRVATGDSPPMEPYPDSVWWLSSDSRAIELDPETATLVIRLELAVNAIETTARYGVDGATGTASGAARMRGLFVALLIHGGYVREAVNILTGTGDAPGRLQRVTELALATNVQPELVKTIRSICGGGHSACAVLTMLRNKLGFHWDPAPLRKAALDFVPNGTIVWVEAPEVPPEQLIHRFAIEVAGNALFPDVDSDPTDARDKLQQKRITDALTAVDDAGNAIVLFFSHAIRGYLQQIGVDRHERTGRADGAPR